MHAPLSCCVVARGGAKACGGGGGGAARATNGVASSHLFCTGRRDSCSPRRTLGRSRHRSRWCSLGCSRHHTMQCTRRQERRRRRSLDLRYIPYNLRWWPRYMAHRSEFRVRCHGSHRCSWSQTMGDDCRTCCSVCLSRRRPAARCRVRTRHHSRRSHLRSAAAARRRSFHRCSFRHSSRGRRAGSETRWRGRAARGERASAEPVSTRGDWPNSDCGPDVRVDGMARATSQSAEPRSWRRPWPPPQPTRPAPAQPACSDGEVGRARCARQTRARQHDAVMHARRAMSRASPESGRPACSRSGKFTC